MTTPFFTLFFFLFKNFLLRLTSSLVSFRLKSLVLAPSLTKKNKKGYSLFFFISFLFIKSPLKKYVSGDEKAFALFFCLIICSTGVSTQSVISFDLKIKEKISKHSVFARHTKKSTRHSVWKKNVFNCLTSMWLVKQWP